MKDTVLDYFKWNRIYSSCNGIKYYFDFFMIGEKYLDYQKDIF